VPVRKRALTLAPFKAKLNDPKLGKSGSHTVTDLIQLIYSSKPFGFDEAALNQILIIARRNNPRDSITGALICRLDLYLQLLEGPQAAVEATAASPATSVTSRSSNGSRAQ
jgi:hypothetical protein